MKRLLFIISALSICTVAIADQITINWGVDSSIYDTTTCEIVGDVALPTTPTKRGYIFRGWQKNYNRGTFDNWSSVPSNTNQYSADTNDNRTPLENDYIIVRDASLYSAPILIRYNGSTHTFYLDIEGEKYFDIPRGRIAGQYGKKGQILVRTWGEETGRFDIYAGLDKYITKTIGGTPLDNGGWIGGGSRGDTNCSFVVYTVDYKYQGSWKFIYRENWEIYGKNGWQPSEQIISE